MNTKLHNRHLTILATFFYISMFILAAFAVHHAPDRRTKAEAVQWIADRHKERWAEDYDNLGASGVPQCVDLVEYYTMYLKGYYLIGNASLYTDRIDLPSGWEYVDTPQPGDIAVWESTESRRYGHVAIVEDTWECGLFSFISVDGRTGEFVFGGRLNESATTFIRPSYKDGGPEEQIVRLSSGATR